MSKKSEAEATTALATIPDSPYMVLARGTTAVATYIKENIGNEKLSAWDLPRLRVPTGNEARFTTGEESFEGIVIFQAPKKGYWQKEYDGTNAPPDCYSNDLLVGNASEAFFKHIGNPSGRCDGCPLDAWGTGRDGRGKACGDNRQIFVLRQGTILPHLIVAPATSMKNTKQYLVADMTSRLRLPWQVVTRFSLQQDKSADGKPYNRLKLSFVRDLTEQEIAMMAGYVENIKPLLQATEVIAPEAA